MSATGGITEITIITPEKKRYKGTTVCSINDGFCRKDGVKYALVNVYEEMAKNTEIIPEFYAVWVKITKEEIAKQKLEEKKKVR